MNRPVTHFSLLNKQSKPPPEATFSLTASMHGGVRTVGVGKKACIYLYISLSVTQFRGFDLLVFCKKKKIKKIPVHTHYMYISWSKTLVQA